MLEFEWDAPKNVSNIIKHGIDFEDAIAIFDGDTVKSIDNRSDYGEERIIAIGKMGGIVIVVVYTLRDETLRIISARKGKNRERDAYYQAVTNRPPDG